jgi:hypothetical protein
LLRSISAAHWRAFCVARNARIGILAAFVVFLAIEMLTRGRAFKFSAPLVWCGLFAFFLWVSHRTLVRARQSIGSIENREVPWFEPLSAAVFAGLVLVYHLLMNAGRNFAAPRPTEIITAIKDAVGYAMYGTAIWAIVTIAVASLQLRRDAKEQLSKGVGNQPSTASR